jgi:uncharacterized protein YggE
LKATNVQYAEEENASLHETTEGKEIPVMFKRVTISLLVCLVLLTVAVGCAPAASSVEAPKSIERSITVVGEGKVSVTPDVAEANVGVEVLAPTVKEATAEAKERMTAIMAALEKAGIAGKDIQTSSYSIYFERYPEVMATTEATPPEVEGNYRVSNMVRVKIRDLDKIGAVLDEVIEAGANNVYGVNFTLDDPSEVRSQARAKAIDNAKAKAQELAGLNGVSLGEVLQVSEVIGGSFPTIGMPMAVEYAGGGGPISPGELEFSVQIQVTYAIAL